METEGREDTTHELTNSTWPWLPDPANVPAPLLQRPLDAVSDWISSERLCDVCSRFAIDEEGAVRNKARKGWEKEVEYINFEHRTAEDLERVAGAAARAGESCCPLCALIWRRMRDHFVCGGNGTEQVTENEIQPGANTYAKWEGWKNWQEQGRDVDLEALETEFSQEMAEDYGVIQLHGWLDYIEIVHQLMPFSYDRFSRIRTLTLYTLPDAPSAGKVRHHLPWRSLTQAAQYAASWTRQCLHNHKMCPKSIESPLPKRLVDVGRYGSSETPYIWINPSEISVPKGNAPATPIMGTYVALSYCWGLEPFEVINPENLTRFTEEIPVKRLPLTIQDAIEFTRLLGIRYLWVDSLCILQGSSDEAKADWNEESVKMQTIYKNALLTIGAAAGNSAYAGIRPTADPPAIPFCALPKGFGGSHMPGQVYAGLQETALHEDAIHRRAWTFQEFLLSARYVNLGDPKIYWYCKEIHWNSQNDLPTDPYPRMTHENGMIDYMGYAEWQLIVWDYSSRSISKKEDRLIALGGVAKDLWLRGGQQDEYLAGLWRSTITRDIIWRGEKDPYSPLTPGIPSWSWASPNKGVDWIGVHERCNLECARFLGSNLVGDPDQFGHSVKGSIRFKGWIRKALVQIGIGRGTGNLIYSRIMPHPFAFSWLDNPIDAERQQTRVSSGEQHFEVLCLQIHQDQSGLLLLSEGPDGGRYRRIGMFVMDKNEEFYGTKCDIIELV